MYAYTSDIIARDTVHLESNVTSCLKRDQYNYMTICLRQVAAPGALIGQLPSRKYLIQGMLHLILSLSFIMDS